MLLLFLIQDHPFCKTNTNLLGDKCGKMDHLKALVAVHLGSAEDYMTCKEVPLDPKQSYLYQKCLCLRSYFNVDVY